MEKSLEDKERRLDTLKQRKTRTTVQPGQYARTVARPGGVYKYRRPHFSTSPYFTDTSLRT